MTTALTIGTSNIREIDGFYSLNNLHRASGGEDKNKPANFLRLDQTKDLIAEIEQCSDMSTALTVRRGGTNPGTYACKEIVVAYAAWISAQFHLKVIRVFLNQVNPEPLSRRLNTPEETGEKIHMMLHSMQAGAMSDELKLKIIKQVKTRYARLFREDTTLRMQDIAERIRHGRFLTTFDDRGAMCLREVPSEAAVMTLPQLLKAIASPGDLPISTEELAAFISAASQRLAKRFGAKQIS